MSAIPSRTDPSGIESGRRGPAVRNARFVRDDVPQKEGITPSNAFAIALFAVFALMLFAALVGATSAYRNIADDRASASETRIGTSLLANAVRAADATDAVSSAEGPEGQALVLTEHLASGDFETRLYLSEGWVVQEYAVADAPINPGGAVRLTPSQTFWFETEPTEVRLGCDAGETTVALRSNGAVQADAARAEEAGGQVLEGGE